MRKLKYLGIVFALVLTGVLTVAIVSAANVGYDSSPGSVISDGLGSGIGNVSDTITVSESGKITDVNVDLTISHTWVGDLRVTVEHDDTGTVVELITNPGGPGIGCLEDNYNDILLDDDAAAPIQTQCVENLTGTFSPDGDLSDFNGEDLNGDWTLVIDDPTGGDGGTLDKWSLHFEFDQNIDIKPGSDPNSINPGAKGVIPVAILGSAAFDVEAIDRDTLRFGPNAAEPTHRAGGHLSDVNDDGFMDLVSHYRTMETEIEPGDTEACVTGALLDGTLFGPFCDDIVTVPPGP